MGVDVLLSSPLAISPKQATENPSAKDRSQGLKIISIDLVDTSPFQPRTQFDAEQLKVLADSIRTQGIIQPIVVRRKGDRYELIAGERRWRAAQLAGLLELQAIVKEVDDTSAAAMALVENIQREELSPIEQANAMAKLIEQFDWTHQQVADAVGKARATVSNTIRLLELSGEVRQMVADGRLEMGHARALLSLDDEQQRQAARHIVEKELTVRATEKFVRSLQGKARQNMPATTSKKDPNIRQLEQTLADRLGAPVEIRHSPASGKGTVAIKYSGLDELEGILGHLNDS